MAHDVYISYSNRDKPIADGICANLEAAGVRCWIAPRDITPGEDWPTSITKAISQSRVMVLVFSADSNSSEDISRELFLAANSKLIIIPFKIEDIEPEPGKQYYLARTHWLDAINPPTQEQIRSLIDSVKAVIPVRAPATVAVVQPSASQGVVQPVLARPLSTPMEKTTWMRLLWIAGIVLVVLCLVGLFILAASTHIIPFSSALNKPGATIPPNVHATDTAAPTAQASATIQTTVPWNLNIMDDFSSNIHDWPIWTDKKDTCSINNLHLQNGAIFWKMDGFTGNNCFYFAYPTEFAPSRDFDVSVDVQRTANSGQGDGGIAFRAKDNDNFYTFGINDTLQSFIILYYQSGSMNTLTDWTMDQAIRSGQVNHLTVSGRGSHFTFSINGKQVATLDNDGIYSGYVGLGIDIFNGASISFMYDNFEYHGNY
jgi:hypothetical protein